MDYKQKFDPVNRVLPLKTETEQLIEERDKNARLRKALEEIKEMPIREYEVAHLTNNIHKIRRIASQALDLEFE